MTLARQNLIGEHYKRTPTKVENPSFAIGFYRSWGFLSTLNVGILKMASDAPACPDGKVLKYTAYITLRDGRRIYAASRGLKAFAIWVSPGK